MKKIISVIILVFAGAAVFVSAVPPNDDFVNRVIISGSNGTVAGSNVGATLEPGETHYGNSNTVWWTWTPPYYAVYQLDTFGSSFDTYLSVFIGDSVTTLYAYAFNNDALGTRQSAVCLEVGPGSEYQIQVSGYNAGDVGAITLNWHMITVWSDWIFNHHYTDTYFTVEFGNDLSALSFRHMLAWKSYYRTNELGCEDWKFESSHLYTNGFTITDKKNDKRIDNKLPEGIGANFSFQDYDGKRLLFYDRGSNKLIVYMVKKGAFVKSNEQTVDIFDGAYFNGSEIYVWMEDYKKEGLKVFDKKLKKEKWTDPLAEGNIRNISKGLTAREIEISNVVNIICKKKGIKIVSQHSITNPPDTTLNIAYDSKGGFLYWTEKSNTNSPLTYLNRNSDRIVDYQSLIDVGDVWDFQSFDGKTLYVRKPLGSTSNTFYAYKVKGLINLGEKNVSGWTRLEANGKAYIYTDDGSGNGVIVCDKRLKKEKWSDPPADGNVWRLTKEIFIRKTTSTNGDIVTETYKLFNKKGEIVSYIFSYTN